MEDKRVEEAKKLDELIDDLRPLLFGDFLTVADRSKARKLLAAYREPAASQMLLSVRASLEERLHNGKWSGVDIEVARIVDAIVEHRTSELEEALRQIEWLLTTKADINMALDMTRRALKGEQAK